MSEPVAAANPSALNLTNRVAEIRQLLVRNLAAQDFFKEIAGLLRADDDSAAAVWMMSESRSLGLYAESGLSQSGLLDDPRATHAHQKLLAEGCLSDSPVVRSHVLPEYFPGHQLLLIPIRRDGKPVGVIEAFGKLGTEAEDHEEALADLGEIADCVDRFLERLQDNERRRDPERSLLQFREFANQLHGSLAPRRVHAVAANELSLLCGGDRVTTLEVSRRSARVRAVSGQSRHHHHSRQIRMLEEIVGQVSKTRQRFLFPHGEAPLPENLIRLLSDYLEETSAQMVLIEPVFDHAADPNDDEEKRPVTRRTQIAAVVFEQFDDSLPHPSLLEKAEPCCRQFGLALNNAKQYSRLQSVPGLAVIAACWQGMTKSRLAIACLLMTLLSAGVWSLLAFEQDLRISCRGQLMPVERQHVFAPADGEVARVFVAESQQVNAGDPLFEMVSPELDAQLLELSSRIRQKVKERDAIRADMRAVMASPSRDQSARLQADYEVVMSELATIEEQVQLLSAEQGKLLVTAPLSGTVTTSRPRDRLLHKPVQRGEHLIELMSEQGPWQLELEFPERRAGHLLGRESDGAAEVRYRLAAYPEEVWQGQVTTISDRTVLSQQYGTAVKVFCGVNEQELPQRRIGMDVHAQVHCGPRSLMFIYFGELKEFLQRRWWL